MPHTFARTPRGALDAPTRRNRRIGVACAAAASAVAIVVTGGGPAVADPTVAVSPAALPSWTLKATRTGPLASNAPVSLTVVLNMHDAAGAAAAAAAVSDPGSSSYGRYMDAASFRSKYSATDADVTSVTSWLTGAGFSVTSVPSNHLWVKVAGTAGAVQKAFGTSLDGYSLNGRALHAPSGSTTIPSNVKPLVSGIAGLSSTTRRNLPQVSPEDVGDLAKYRATATLPAPRLRATAPTVTPSPNRLGVAPPSPAFVNATPCSKYWAEKMATTAPPAFGQVQPYAPCGYTPTQLRGGYELDKIKPTGSGVTVAILDAYASPTARADANTYATRQGGKAFTPGQYQEVTPAAYQYGYEDTVNGNLCGESGWYGEQTLDIEAVHGIAPNAHVTYVGAASCLDSDLLDGLNNIVDNQLAQIITNSWGEAGEPDPAADSALLQAYDYVFVQAALQGIGVFFSSGDSGDEVDNAGFRTADFPASSPWVTAVGGTSIAIGAKDNYIFETGWGTGRSRLVGSDWSPAPPGTHQYGAGGGTSQTFAQPFYQRGVVPASISQYFGGAPGRAVPDIAAIGDPNTGFLVGQTQTFPDGSVRYSEYRIGGTSLASPVMAGIEAMADEAAKHPHGFANPAIYKLLGTRALRDVAPLGTAKAVVRQDFANGVDATGGISVTLRSLDQTQTLATRVGYDDVTGVGSPFGPKYVFDLGDKK